MFRNNVYQVEKYISQANRENKFLILEHTYLTFFSFALLLCFSYTVNQLAVGHCHCPLKDHQWLEAWLGSPGPLLIRV